MFDPRLWRLPLFNFGALMAFPGSLEMPRNPGSFDGNPVGLPERERLTPACASKVGAIVSSKVAIYERGGGGLPPHPMHVLLLLSRVAMYVCQLAHRLENDCVE